jgi:hypothetical protein
VKSDFKNFVNPMCLGSVDIFRLIRNTQDNDLKLFTWFAMEVDVPIDALRMCDEQQICFTNEKY